MNKEQLQRLGALTLLAAAMLLRLPSIATAVSLIMAAIALTTLITTLSNKKTVAIMAPYIAIPILALLIPLPLPETVPALIRLAIAISFWGGATALGAAITNSKTLRKSIKTPIPQTHREDAQ